MGSAKHSSSPWYMMKCGDEYNDLHYQVWGDKGELVAIGHNLHDGEVISASLDLLNALIGLGGMPDGYCFCPENRDPTKTGHTGECANAWLAIKKARGE